MDGMRWLVLGGSQVVGAVVRGACHCMYYDVHSMCGVYFVVLCFGFQVFRLLGRLGFCYKPTNQPAPSPQPETEKSADPGGARGVRVRKENATTRKVLLLRCTLSRGIRARGAGMGNRRVGSLRAPRGGTWERVKHVEV